jgi:hypothetical protein
MIEGMGRRHALALALIIISLVSSGCHYPLPVTSKRSIAWASTAEWDLVIVQLPLRDWPRLQKFKALEDLRISEEMASEVSDEHLKVLSKLKFPKLRGVSFWQSSRVTDSGLLLLTNFPTITFLLMAGVGISDSGLEALAKGLPKLDALNVEGCPNVSARGIMSLTNSPTVRSVTISFNLFTQQQVEELISRVTNVSWWLIHDPQGRMDAAPLRQLGLSRGITIQVADENRLVRSITLGPVR